MANAKAISGHIQKRLASQKRDGVAAVEATEWLIEAGLLREDRQPHSRLLTLLREGKIKGAYQFPNKRWVVVNSSLFPDGIQRVVPMKEAAKVLKISEKSLRRFTKEEEIRALDFGPTPPLFLEEELRRFRAEVLDPSYELDFVKNFKKGQMDFDKLKRQLYYLRSDIRLIVERIEELIRLLE
ncbi:MAG: hypothetical protein JSW58_04260 [Candidatus Latescibacterota bacterium]|nr:MAG: hypothetical protein JSW58_04260 [Candidatus Latescibacterota bacterium]